MKQQGRVMSTMTISVIHINMSHTDVFRQFRNHCLSGTYIHVTQVAVTIRQDFTASCNTNGISWLEIRFETHERDKFNFPAIVFTSRRFKTTVFKKIEIYTVLISSYISPPSPYFRSELSNIIHSEGSIYA